MQANTQIKIQDREGLFTISFQDRNPKLASDYVNALLKRYISDNSFSNREDSYGATQFFSEQLKTHALAMDYQCLKSTLLMIPLQMRLRPVGTQSMRSFA